ncbi:MAG: DegT/DnrJ/EryC1/StrS family aminotransferase [Bermanella sp.]
MLNLSRYNPIGDEEKKAAMRVLDSGNLSAFIGAWGEGFHGGEEVKAFESELADYFSVKHVVTFNSLTSGLIAAIGAIGIEPGDEVIVSPWTMSATATAIVVWGGIPVFVDIEKNFYGLDPSKVKQAITKHTKAILVTDIFGHGAKLDELENIAKQHDLKLIEDVAQAPGIKFKNKLCGRWGEIGGFSLNYHKHIHTGEGGFCITDDDNLALKMKMIRNHAEASIVNSPLQDLSNMVGFNFRMGEIEAAIGREQLKKLPALLKINQEKAQWLYNRLKDTKSISLPKIEESSSHAYYVFPIQLNFSKQNGFLKSLEKEQLPGLVARYVNVHRLPMFEHKVAFGRGYPWNMAHREIDYQVGICPVAEDLNDHYFIGLLISMYDMNEEEVNQLCDIFERVLESTLNET